jgi:DNA polymerase-1
LFVSVMGDSPGWPFNRVVKKLADLGEELEAHQPLEGDAQAVKTWCPGPAHAEKAEGGGTRALVFAEQANGRVRAYCFKKDDTRPILEHFGLTLEDLRRGPGGELLTWQPGPEFDVPNPAEVRAELHQLRVRRDARRLLDAEDRPPAQLPEILTLRDRLAQPQPPVTWRIEGWQPTESRVVLAAQFKAGKTTMSGNLARCLVDGDLWLGRLKVTPITGVLGLIDFEMSGRQLDAWLRDQRIVNDDRVVIIPMRGAAGAFDLADPAVRARWVRLLRSRGVAYLVWDCLRPVLDALGLDEHRDAGRLLTAFDTLLAEADIGESMVIHHMGHAGERSRGDSRIRDWPDVEWRLVRQDDDPASPRFVTAFGRDVDVAESRLTYDPTTRHLELVGGSRKDVATRAALGDVLVLLAAEPGLSGRQIEDKLGESTEHTRGGIRAAVKAGVRDRSIRTESGPRGAVLHFQCASAPQRAASALARSSGECASAPPPIEGGALRTDSRGPDRTPSSAPGLTAVLSESELAAALPEILAASVVGLDIETMGANPLNPFASEIRLVQLAVGGMTYVVDIATVPIKLLQPVLDQAKTIVVHNGVFDFRHLAHAGLTLPADLGSRVRDTLVAAKVLTAGDDAEFFKASLEEVCQRYLGIELDKTEQKSDWSGELTDAQVAYAAKDAAVLLPLREKLGGLLAEADLLGVARIENRAMVALVWLEDSGFRFDLDRLDALAKKTQADVEAAEAALLELVGKKANWSSPKQVLEVFHDLGIEAGGTAEEVVKGIDHPIGPLLLAYRKARKLAGMFGADYAKYVEPATGRVHADFKQLGSRAGRMSCKDPNLQQVPKAPEYRECFRAPAGRKLVKADYSQIELRIAAEISGDANLLEAYAAGEDLHALTARKVLGAEEVTKAHRQAAKAVNFGLIYGMGATKLRGYARNTYGVEMTEDEATNYRQAFFEAYPGLLAWHRSMPYDPVDTRTLTGRRRLQVVRFTEKLNSPVQGSGADGIKEALALLFERREQCPGAFPVNVVHDEIVVECDEDQVEKAKAWLEAAMVDGMSTLLTKVPVEVESVVSDSWAG